MTKRSELRTTLQVSVARAFVWCGVLLGGMLPLRVSAHPCESDQTPYRIGIVAYDDIRARAEAMEKTFMGLGHPVRFASGSAEEVLDWVTQGAVDIAVLSPGAFVSTGAVLRREERNQRLKEGTYPAWDAKYLITPELQASNSPFASPERRKDGGFVYKAVALINRNSLTMLSKELPNLPDAELIKRAYEQDKVQFVFGDPLSLSGTIVPRAQLKVMGIDLKRGWEYSFGHKDTLQLLLDEPEVTIRNRTRHRVGFVFDASVPGAVPSIKGSDTAEWKDQRLAQMARDLVELRLPPPEEPSAISIAGRDQATASLAFKPKSTDSAVDDLPAEVWVVRPDFDTVETDRLRSALSEITVEGRRVFLDQGDPDQTPNDVDKMTARVRKWAADGGTHLGDSARFIDFDQIVHSMRHYQRRFGSDPRLALVLSGGGAKCAYQAGVIASLERQISEFRELSLPVPRSKVRTRKPFPLDIGLVAGTSGGALNALPAAIGVTAKKRSDGFLTLPQVWKQSDLVDVLDPYPGVSFLLGVWAALTLALACRLVCNALERVLQAMSVLKARFASAATSPGRVAAQSRGEISLVLYVLSLLGSLAVILAFLILRQTSEGLLRENTPSSTWLYYLIWLPLHVSGLWIVSVLGILVGLQWLKRDKVLAPELAALRLGGASLAALLALTCTSLFFYKTISAGERMQFMVAKQILKVLEGEIRPDLSETGGVDQDVTALGAAIADPEQPRRRDFVMAISVLDDSAAADRYAYLPATGNGVPPTYGERALDLNRASGLNFLEDPNQVVKLVTASGTIFPLFPAKAFPDPSGRRDDIFVVDGGFAHNVPVEAAVDWGATHILVVEVSPRTPRKQESTLYRNLATAFDHLFEQAQLTDVRSRDQIEIYNLRPKDAILRTIDFIPALLKKAVKQGRKDARSGAFTQFARPPRFTRADGTAERPL